MTIDRTTQVPDDVADLVGRYPESMGANIPASILQRLRKYYPEYGGPAADEVLKPESSAFESVSIGQLDRGTAVAIGGDQERAASGPNGRLPGFQPQPDRPALRDEELTVTPKKGKIGVGFIYALVAAPVVYLEWGLGPMLAYIPTMLALSVYYE